MGESSSFFTIPAYLKVGRKRLKVIKWGITGAVVESSPVIESHKPVKADFIFPYDVHNKLVIPDIKISCSPENGTLFCRFEELSEEQEEILKFLIREYLWKRIISIPDEFMNYTQDEEMRKELLALQKDSSLRVNLRKIMYVIVPIAILGAIIVGFKIFTGERNSEPAEPAVNHTEVKTAEVTNGTNFTEEEENASVRASGEKGIEENTLSSEEEKVKTVEVTNGTNFIEEEENASVRASGEKGIEENTLSSEEKAKTVETPELETTVTSSKERIEEENSNSIGLTSSTTGLSEEEDYYCVQVATDVSAERLIKLAQNLKGFPYVRVEKIGRYYTLRVGFDESFRKDRKLADEIRKKVGKSVFPRICAYRPERWVYPQEEVR